MKRRKFVKASAIGITSLVSLPVLGNNTCSVSGALSGNMSDNRIDVCSQYTPGRSLDRWVKDLTPFNSKGWPIVLGINGGMKPTDFFNEVAGIPGISIIIDETQIIYSPLSLETIPNFTSTIEEKIFANLIGAVLNARNSSNTPYTDIELIYLVDDIVLRNNFNELNILLEVLQRLNGG